MNEAAANIDLDLYCRRIGFDGKRHADLATLRSLLHLHTHRIAFENLDSFCGHVVATDYPTLQQKLLVRGRGAYCFEHNTMLWNVLDQFGFKVRGLAARVRWNLPPDVIRPIGHMLLLVSLDGNDYIADAGFGGITLTAPLLLRHTDPQATSHEPFRLRRESDQYTLQVALQNEWHDLYCFDLANYVLADYSVWNWFTCTSPQSPFTSLLMAARPDANGRHALKNNEYSWHAVTGASHTRRLNSAAEIVACLRAQFRIAVPESDVLAQKLDELAAQS